ncbi:MAG TPA: tryptophan-rich sensory protein [Fimbriiglobus sp.]|jgi:tryptophan-rich sensory protein|nr:tryptophan-rich sensory protein [Fimbriiglobus sp.]
MILDPVTVASSGFVFVPAFRRRVPVRVVLPFAVNLVANLLIMPTFAGLRSVPLAAADVVIVWAAIVWCVVAVWPHHKWVAVARGPYFVWVSLATAIQVSITVMNG